MLPAKRVTDSPPMRQLLSSLLAKPMKPETTITTRKPKSGVIDWPLSKPEIISVEALDLQHYTSLRDVMLHQYQEELQQNSTEIGSGGGGGSGGSSPRTRMKNHLVEQAARAYLQPLNVEWDVKTTRFLPWNWQKIMGYTPLTFSMSMPKLTVLPRQSSGNGGQWQCCGLTRFFSKFSLSGILRYLLGRVKPQQAGFLKFV